MKKPEKWRGHLAHAGISAWARRPRHAHALALLCALVISGCAGSGGGGQAVAPSNPNAASLTVIVKAEPKSGWRDPGQTSDYEPARVGMGTAFKTLDYSDLDEIVVWVSTSSPIPIQPPNLKIDIAKPVETELVAGSGAIWQIRNSTKSAEVLFLRAESGQVQNLGGIVPGGLTEFSPELSGPLELLADSRPQPIARVFVAPSPVARIVKARQKVAFNNLPPGPATVSCWHPRLPGSTADVVLQPGQNSTVTLTLTVNQLPKVP